MYLCCHNGLTDLYNYDSNFFKLHLTVGFYHIQTINFHQVSKIVKGTKILYLAVYIRKIRDWEGTSRKDKLSRIRDMETMFKFQFFCQRFTITLRKWLVDAYWRIFSVILKGAIIFYSQRIILSFLYIRYVRIWLSDKGLLIKGCLTIKF